MATSRPEPMNATTNHSKVKVSLNLANNKVFVAGGYISGAMEMECKADKGLGIGVMMVELFAIQELTSRDHSATSTFLHSRRLFQGPGLPPSNAVQPHPVPGEPPFPSNYHQARRGQSTFLFKFPLPSSSPSSINFGGDLARVRYELRASVGVLWKGEKRLVTARDDIQVVECFNEDPSRPEPEGVVVGENGKIWAQGKIVGGVIVAGESGCVELQVKNHSTKKNTGLVITLTRTLVLSGIPASEKQPLQISDTLVTVPFRGEEYIIPPGAEGVASLVFDVPKHARGVKGGLLYGDESAPKPTQSIFEVRCVLGIKMTMGFGNKDIELDLPVSVVHPLALPELPPPPPMGYDYGYQHQYGDPHAATPYGYPALPMSPPIPAAYMDPQHGQVWLPPPSHTPQPYQYYSPSPQQQPQYFFPPPPTSPVYQPLPLNLARPLSAGGNHETNLAVPGQVSAENAETGEEGKGERAARVSQHLRQSTRNRSASPLSHRFPLPSATSMPIPQTLRNVPPADTNGLSVSPAAGAGPAVFAPRPVLSPKTSFAHPSTPKSERVEELERMADEVALKSTNLSGDLPKSTLSADTLLAPPAKEKRRKSKSPSKRSSKREKAALAAALAEEAQTDGVEIDFNKTLPGPPVPTGKAAALATPRARVDTYFGLPASASASAQLTPRAADEEQDQGLAQTPKTPTLTAMRRPGLLAPEGGFSGLDALERRLLQEVGTRKMPAAPRPDARSVVAAAPVDIPLKRGDSADDSAISSLTLAGDVQEREQDRDREREREREQEEEHDRDSDERTQGAKKSSSGRTERGDGERRSSRKKEKEKGKDRKAAKGRVAAWLGGIDPEVPPDADAVPPSPEIEGVFAPVQKAAVSPDNAPAPVEAPSVIIPNPRSSGFVPVKTFKRDPFQRNPAEEAKRIQDLWSSPPIVKEKSPVFPRLTSPTHTPQSVHTNHKVSPPSSPFKVNGAAALNGWKAPASSAAGAAAPRKVVSPSPRLPAFPPLLDPEVKYDIRSARGGRGGKVTAVASLWASGAVAEKSKDAAPKPVTSPKPATAPKPVTAPIPAPKPTPAPKPVPAAKPTTAPKPPTSPKPATAADFLRSKPLVAPKPVKPVTAAEMLRSIPTLDKVAEATRTAPSPAEKRTARAPMIKSASVPALISSSHARPTLSSTASLARPPPKLRAPPAKPMPTMAETASEVVAGLKGRVQTSLSSVPAKAPAPSSGSKPGEMAFGQAKLRDLIKKYQGQAAAG
ncbi:hypothetical protein DFH06DRAFT_1232550 [Mycena polygramma]|nr:hypothetical protein DFH06DRAFT_1232550 [Mycena polygramma]